MSEPLTKVDSAVAGLSSSPTNEKKIGHKKTGSTGGPQVHSIADLEKDGVKISVAPETQKLNWKLNTSPASLGEADTLKKPLITPLVKKIDIAFPMGLEVTARNLKGVTIKDALDAIYKQFKKKQDDELEDPILKGFEWDPEESWTRLKIHQKKEGAPVSKKAKKKGGEE